MKKRAGRLPWKRRITGMSQAKVDRYKEEKKNRKQIMAREKRNWFLTQLCLALVGLLIVVWVGFSAYQAITKPAGDAVQEVKTYTLDNSAIEDYLDSLEES
jgi:hypothetical protein